MRSGIGSKTAVCDSLPKRTRGKTHRLARNKIKKSDLFRLLDEWSAYKQKVWETLFEELEKELQLNDLGPDLQMLLSDNMTTKEAQQVLLRYLDPRDANALELVNYALEVYSGWVAANNLRKVTKYVMDMHQLAELLPQLILRAQVRAGGAAAARTLSFKDLCAETTVTERERLERAADANKQMAELKLNLASHWSATEAAEREALAKAWKKCARVSQHPNATETHFISALTKDATRSWSLLKGMMEEGRAADETEGRSTMSRSVAAQLVYAYKSYTSMLTISHIVSRLFGWPVRHPFQREPDAHHPSPEHGQARLSRACS